MLTAHLEGARAGTGPLDSQTEVRLRADPGSGRSAKHLTRGLLFEGCGQEASGVRPAVGVCKRNGLYSTKTVPTYIHITWDSFHYLWYTQGGWDSAQPGGEGAA